MVDWEMKVYIDSDGVIDLSVHSLYMEAMDREDATAERRLAAISADEGLSPVEAAVPRAEVLEATWPPASGCGATTSAGADRSWNRLHSWREGRQGGHPCDAPGPEHGTTGAAVVGAVVHAADRGAVGPSVGSGRKRIMTNENGPQRQPLRQSRKLRVLFPLSALSILIGLILTITGFAMDSQAAAGGQGACPEAGRSPSG